MGQTVEATCQECGYIFELDEGGGFFFHILYCNKCGKTKNISFEDITDKIKANPYIVPKLFTIKDENLDKIEKYAGKCKCGGKFLFFAKPRCPKCKSARILKGKTIMLYD
jgi:hypothetical protein